MATGPGASLAVVARTICAASDVESVVQTIHHEAAVLLGADFADVALFEGSTTDGATAPSAGAAGVAKLAAAPLVDGSGVTIGVLTFGWRVAESFDPRVESIIETLAALCGQTLGRTRLTDRAFEFAHLGAALAAAATATEIAQLVADHGRDVLGAAHANLRVVGKDRRSLESLLPIPLPPELAEKYRHVPLDANVPAAEAVRRNAPIWLTDDQEYLDRYADAGRDASTLGYRCTVALPIRSTAGEPIGVVGMAWNHRVAIDATFQATLLTIATAAGQALQRAMLAERAGRSARRHEAIANLARRIAGEHDLDRILALVAAEIGPIMDADRAGVTLTDAGAGSAASTQPPDAGGWATTQRLPMTDATGRAFGSLEFRWRTARTLDSDEMAALTTLTELAARMIERARTEITMTSRAVALGRLTQRLATSMTTAQLTQVLEETLPELLGSRQVMALVADDLDGLQAAATALPAELREATGTAFTQGRTLLFGDRASLAQEYRALGEADGPLAASSHAAPQAFAHLPLHDASGLVRGVLCVLWSAPRAFDLATRSLLATVADLAGQTLERTRLYDSEHATVMALQRRLLGPPARVDGFDIAVHYEPGDGAVAIGGDWYDTVVRPDGTLVVVVGDVAGHGVAAVAAMAQVQYLIAGLIRTNRPLHRILADVNEMIDELGFATAQIFELDRRRRRLGYQSAGHPWALVRRPDGRVDRLDAGACPPIGVPRSPEPLAYTDFGPATLLLAYTDGLVERRDRSIVESIDRLADALGKIEPDGDVGDMLNCLVSAARNPSLSGEVFDDEAAVLIRASD